MTTKLIEALRKIRDGDERESHPCGPKVYGWLGSIARSALEEAEREAVPCAGCDGYECYTEERGWVCQYPGVAKARAEREAQNGADDARGCDDQPIEATLRQWIVALNSPTIEELSVGDITLLNGGSCITEDLQVAADEIARLRARVEQLQRALEPFAACVFNDNFDMTVMRGNVRHDDFVRAYYAVRRVRMAAAAQARKEG